MTKILAAVLMFAALGAKAALPTVGTPPGQRYMISGGSITAVNGSFSGSVTASSVTSHGDASVVGNLGIGEAASGTIGLSVKKGEVRFWNLGQHELEWGNGNIEFFEWLSGTGGGTILNNKSSPHSGGYISIPTGGAARMGLMPTSGSVGIGTASPCSTCTLHVAGGASVMGALNAGNGSVGYFTVSADGHRVGLTRTNFSHINATDANGSLGFGAGGRDQDLELASGGQLNVNVPLAVKGSTFTVATTGIVSAPSQPGAGANRASSALSIADSTATELLFNSNNYTQGGLGFTSKSTAPVAGIYYVGCGVSWVSNATGVRQLCIVSSNIGQEACDVRFAGAAGAAINQSISKMVSLAANNTVSCTVTQTSGGPLNAEASEMTYGVLQKVW